MSAIADTFEAAGNDWSFGDWLLHRVDDDHFVLYDPRDRDVQPVIVLAAFGISGDWLTEQEHAGPVLVTHMHRP